MLIRWSALPMSPVMASFTPRRYPIPNPTAQPATAQPSITRQIRAASSAQTTEASAERNHVIAPEGLMPSLGAGLIS